MNTCMSVKAWALKAWVIKGLVVKAWAHVLKPELIEAWV